MNKTRLGFREKVILFGKKTNKKILARIDTGASKCSIDTMLAKKLGLHLPIIGHTTVKSAQGSAKRKIIKAKIEIAKRKMNVRFTLANRKRLKHDILIGRNVLRKGFIIDSAKK